MSNWKRRAPPRITTKSINDAYDVGHPQPKSEAYVPCAHDLDDDDTCKLCGENFTTHLALKGAGLL